MIANLVNGARATLRNYRLVLLISAWHTALAAVAVAPALNWWRRAFDHSVEATSLLNGFNFGVLADLTKYDYVGAFGLLTSAITGAMVLSLVSGCFIMGGIVNVISGPGTPRGVMHRFFVGSGCFFWRFFRLMLLGGTCSVLAGAVITIALAAVGSAFSDYASEAGVYAWLLFDLAMLVAACGLFLLALDYARIHVVVHDARGMFKAYVRSLGFVLRHPVTTYGMAIAILGAGAVLLLAYVAYETVSPVATTWTLIFLLIVIQQLVLITRVGLRVSLLEAEFFYAQGSAEAAKVEQIPSPTVAVTPGPADPLPAQPASK